MTEKIGACAKAAAAPGTKIIAVTPHQSPASIDGYSDGALALPGLLGEIQKGEADPIDGYIIACFDDTGLDACRQVAAGSVVGICQAGRVAASMILMGFSVVKMTEALIGAGLTTSKIGGYALSRAKAVSHGTYKSGR